MEENKTNLKKLSHDNLPKKLAPTMFVASNLRDCCKDTIDTHALYNPMILCQSCKRLIKCFKEEREFRNYVVFCQSRGRRFDVGDHGEYKAVIFENYEPFR